MTAPATTSRATGAAERLSGPDVVRAVALIGVVVMNYHGYLILRADGPPGTGWLEDLFDPWDGPMSTRFAATFVLVAGVGVTLMTASSVGARALATTADAIALASDRVQAMRWRLVRRGLLLYVTGLLLEEIWPGTIIVYYGAMFVVAAAMFTWRSRWLIVVGVAAAIGGSLVRLWRNEQALDGVSTAWLTEPDEGSLRDHVFGVIVNGTHPLLPWLAFLCAGMVLGRLLRTPWWRSAALGAGLALVGVGWLVSSQATTAFEEVALSINPLDRGVIYTASALGTALVAYACVDWLATRYPVATDPLRRAGQMTLSLYIAHVLVFNLVVDWLGWIEPAGVEVALAFALGFWIVGIAAAVAWQRRLGMGPAERIYRTIGG
ncbi:MAG TPA: DUF418 domain-containing protein [Ilumatobacteraceae bacterium]|nr:DUF418 domain-containing protein [Ilumatobacteraceae bacterium]